MLILNDDRFVAVGRKGGRSEFLQARDGVRSSDGGGLALKSLSIPLLGSPLVGEGRLELSIRDFFTLRCTSAVGQGGSGNIDETIIQEHS